MTRKVNISADLIANQRRASDPNVLAWVAANAGSGKTHVLTERVLRLLLSGTPPEQILCLTYTKAAAAEMRKRVAERLGKWTLLDEAALGSALSSLEGHAPDAGRLARARTLFAHALETPGGLKIMTIHAFCESVLHRFPAEAGVPFDFSVIEEFERGQLILHAHEEVMAEGIAGRGVAEAVETLLEEMSDYAIDEAVGEALGQQRVLRHVLLDVTGAKRRLRALLGLGRGATPAAVLTAMAEGYGLDADDHAAIFALVPPDPLGGGFVDKLARIDVAAPAAMALCDAFLTKEYTARKTLLKKADAAALPEIAARLGDEAVRLEALWQELTGAQLLERSEALLDVLAAISARYENWKRARSLLDFDDLIAALAGLLENPAQGAWVRYKLDSGITHILVDEGQDTNPEQWRVVRALTDEFFDGESAAERPRTIFSVGDQKQSIFSFQGAQPELFVDKGNEYGALALSVRRKVHKVELKTSFRTLPDILKAVDLVFAPEALADAVLSEGPVEHHSARAEGGGMVTLWPPVQQEPAPDDPDNWPLQVPKSVKSAPRQVAERIAGEIAGWMGDRRPLGPRGRPVREDDVLVLVQTRGTLFQEVIRALARANLRTPGADRLAVTSHIAVLDLMALGDVLSNPAEDLQLAALLRSPLFEVSEEELYALAQPRPAGATLWSALGASPIPAARAAYERLAAWRGRLDFERPFEFYTEVLYAEGGLGRFHGRLGPEIDDVIAEFLDLALAHEQSPQPSLQGFLAALRAREISIRRELAELGGGVRVMTVHGAKGLEAPIVILADAASTEKGRMRQSVFMTDTPPGPLLLHAGSERAHVAQSRVFRENANAAQQAEYWRKLYVAMTRAEDELYVTGALTERGTLEGSWYEAIEMALRPLGESVGDAEGKEAALLYPKLRQAPQPVVAGAGAPGTDVTPLVLAPLPAYRLPRIVRPSSAFEGADAVRVLETQAEALGALRDPETARREGTALHALLQHLTRIAPEQRDSVVAKALPVLLPDRPDRHRAIGAKAQSILGRPELAAIFGPNSRAEVPVLAHGTRHGLPVVIAGRIDRLVAEPGHVTIVDYKSDAKVPDKDENVPQAYLTQLGLYARIASLLFPGAEVEAKILWTGPEYLMILPDALLRRAAETFTIG